MVITEEKRSAATSEDEASAQRERHEAVGFKGSLLDAVRAFGVMAGPSALFDLFLVGSVIAMVRGALSRHRTNASRRLRPFVALGTAVAVAYPAVMRPWMMRWGATDEERCKPLAESYGVR